MKALKKIVCSVLFLLICIACFCACKKESDGSFFSGKWGYIYEPETTVLSFKGDKLNFEGKPYFYTSDDNYLYLTSGDTTITLRYLISGKHFYIYKTTDYSYEGFGTPNSLVGKWTNPNKWSFEFTADGQFAEDGYFPGRYTSDDKTFKLMYTDHFEDTVCYYTINGKTLTVEYPWEMARSE